MNRLKHTSRLTITVVTLCAIVTMFMVNGAFRAPAAYAASYSTSSPLVSTGSLVRGATVTLSKAGAKSSSTRAIPYRSIHGTSRGGTSVKAPVSNGSHLAGSHPLLENFNGLSGVDSFNVNGTTVEPPDQGLCVHNDYVLEEVNSIVALYHRNGALNSGPFSVNSFFAEPATEFLSDPRCYYDPATQAWFSLILAIDPDNLHSHFDVEVTNAANPLQNAVVYQLDTTDPNGPGCPCFGDQPLFGIDQFNVYVSTNEFSILGPNFNGAQVYALSKSQLVAIASSVNFVHFGNLNIGGAIAASIQPAITDGNPSAEYFLNSLDPNATFDNRIGVWAMTGRQKVTAGGVPTLTSVVVTSEVYGLPPLAVDPAGNNINTDDDRMQQVQYINGELWSSLTTALTIPGDTAERAGAAWFEIRPSLNGQVIGSAHVTDQGYMSSQGNYLMYPAVAASPDGTAVMTMSLTGSNTYPSAVYAVRPAGQHQAFTDIKVAGPGVTFVREIACLPQFGGVCRWGDYSAAVIDSSNNGATIWLATEYIPGAGYTNTNWGTRIMEVKA